ncbi:uncharacterized protein [Zea mays]|uniref:uncharacterized protein n=1 Tax=Zea mays TaxID=4577 RepID=UPI000C6C3E3D|nr:uncharacterized protein LOC111589950 [Zea mays]|eukprot:XP_023156631.1 uncharacterized protein LOC111589950 [Zea mays]
MAVVPILHAAGLQEAASFFSAQGALASPALASSLPCSMAELAQQPWRPSSLLPSPPWRSGRSSHGRHPLQLPLAGAQQQHITLLFLWSFHGRAPSPSQRPPQVQVSLSHACLQQGAPSPEPSHTPQPRQTTIVYSLRCRACAVFDKMPKPQQQRRPPLRCARQVGPLAVDLRSPRASSSKPVLAVNASRRARVFDTRPVGCTTCLHNSIRSRSG